VGLQYLKIKSDVSRRPALQFVEVVFCHLNEKQFLDLMPTNPEANREHMIPLIKSSSISLSEKGNPNSAIPFF
jgi:hypothetical protein